MRRYGPRQRLGDGGCHLTQSEAAVRTRPLSLQKKVVSGYGSKGLVELGASVLGGLSDRPIAFSRSAGLQLSNELCFVWMSVVCTMVAPEKVPSRPTLPTKRALEGL